MIKYGEQTFTLLDNESVLDCLLRHNVDAPYSCRSGICQTCLMRAIEGNPPVAAQKGLKQSQISQNYFLACACYPQQDMVIAQADAQENRYKASVTEITRLADTIIRLRISRPSNFNYFAGQFLTIFKTSSMGRSYSLASVPDLHDYLEFHIRVIDNGQVSPWIAEQLKVGDDISISEPLGNCIYIGAARTQPLLMIGTGTGIGPLLGIAEQAVHSGHEQAIHIYHGVRRNSELYVDEHLKSLAAKIEQFYYYPCVSGEPPEGDARQGRASELALEDGHDLKGFSVFLCGNPEMVNNARRQIFLVGASLQNIHADPFEFK